jgi:hypothetical protein
LKEEALDRIKWKNRFGRGCGPVVWQFTDYWLRIMNVLFKVLRENCNRAPKCCFKHAVS